MTTLLKLSLRKFEGVPKHFSNPQLIYSGLSEKPTWPSAHGGVFHCRESDGAPQNVAVKKYIEGSKDEKLIESEIITMTKHPHPNILKLQSIYIYEGCVFLVTPYYNGGTLQKYCLDNSVALLQMVFILKRVRLMPCIPCNDQLVLCDIVCVPEIILSCPSFLPSGPHKYLSSWQALRKYISAAGSILKRTIIEQGRPHYPQNMDTRLVDFVDRCLEPDCYQRASANELLKVGHIILCKHTFFILFSGAIPNIQRAYGTDAVCLFDSVLLVHQPSIASCLPIAKSPYFRYDLTEPLIASTTQTTSPQQKALTANIPERPESSAANTPQTPNFDLWLDEYA
ncbi:hypothetical protein BC938DRAFT_482202, partial [Jimgerdemannia flammicorona]